MLFNEFPISFLEDKIYPLAHEMDKIKDGEFSVGSFPYKALSFGVVFEKILGELGDVNKTAQKEVLDLKGNPNGFDGGDNGSMLEIGILFILLF